MHAEIDYGGGGLAKIWGEFDADTVEREFYSHANECFGIRKSIMNFRLIKIEKADDLPDPWHNMEKAAFVLEHNCGVGAFEIFKDVIVFDADGEKLKSEFD